MINNHELRRRIEEVKKDLKVLEKQVLELDYQIEPEVTGKAGEVTDVTKECQEPMLAEKLMEAELITGWYNEDVGKLITIVSEHYKPLLQAEYRKGLKQGIERSCNYNDGRKQAIAEMKEKFEGRVNWLSDEYGSRKDFIINLRRNLFQPEEK